MISTRYASDYRLDNDTDGTGKSKHKLVYVGPLYEFVNEPAKVKAAGNHCLIVLAAMWLLWIIGIVLPTSYFHYIYIVLPFVCCAIPLVLLSAGLFYLKTAASPYERIRKERTADRMKAQGLVGMVISAICVPMIIYRIILTGTVKLTDIIFSAMVLAIFAGMLIVFKKASVFAMKESVNPLTKKWAEIR